MAAKALPTTNIVEIINKKSFTTIVLNVDDKTFVVYIAILTEPIIILIHSSHKAQVILLISIEIFNKYFDF